MKRQFTLFALILSIYAFAQNSEKFTLQDIQREFRYKKYSPEVLKKFNSYLLNNQYYTFSEEIPGEIISYTYENENGSTSRVSQFFKIVGEKLIPIKTDPRNEEFKIIESFHEKVAKYAGKNWRFEDRAGYTIKKLRNGNYLISTNFYKETDSNVAPSGYLDYTTKDFKSFIPYRISEDDKNWKLIK